MGKIAKIKYIIIRLLHTLIYIVAPFLTALFINSILAKDMDRVLMVVVGMIVTSLFTQMIDYYVDVYEQDIRNLEYIHLIETLNDKFDKYNNMTSNIEKNTIYQDITQNYELVKNYLAVNQINYYIYIVNILIIFLIAIYYSIPIAIVIVILSFSCMVFPRIFSKKLSLKNSYFLKSCKLIQEYTIDHYVLNKELRFQKNNILKPLKNYTEDYQKSSKAKTKFEAFYTNIVTYGLINGSILTVIIISGFLVLYGEIEIGYIYLFQSYMSQLFSPIEFILDYKTKLHSMKEIIERYKSYSLIEEIDYCEDRIEEIKFNDLKHFNQTIHLTLKKGDFLLITGGNGSGKTTLIHKVLGFDDHTSITINDTNKLYKDIVYIPSSNYESIHKENYQQLSAGESRIVQIRTAIENNKTVYIFDEPTNYIDDHNKTLVLDAIVKLINDDKIVMVVSHDTIFEDVPNKSVLKL